MDKNEARAKFDKIFYSAGPPQPKKSRVVNPQAVAWWTKFNTIYYGTGEGTAPQPLGRRKTGIRIAQEYGHADALMSPKGALQLFKGQWTAVQSSWIGALRYDVEDGQLYVRVKGSKEYGGDTPITPAGLIALASAASKGHEVNKLWRKFRKKKVRRH